MQKYWDFPFLNKIDTFDLAKTVLHFLPSYSLEIISDILKQKQKNIITLNEKELYHDALYDSLSCLNLFKYFVEYV
jgi:DNA polymerase III epsilon subunit-like protein